MSLACFHSMVADAQSLARFGAVTQLIGERNRRQIRQIGKTADDLKMPNTPSVKYPSHSMVWLVGGISNILH
jgi:hypothetical protein